MNYLARKIIEPVCAYISKIISEGESVQIRFSRLAALQTKSIKVRIIQHLCALGDNLKRFPPSLIGKLESKYSRYWWGEDEESLFKNAMSVPFKNIIFTLLSQNPSSENTRRAYSGLISKFEVAPRCLAEADEKKISEAIRPGGLHRVKARRIKEISNYVLSEYDGDLSWVHKEHACMHADSLQKPRWGRYEPIAIKKPLKTSAP